MEEELRDRMGDIFDLENDVVGYPDSSSESGNDWESWSPGPPTDAAVSRKRRLSKTSSALS